MSFRTWCGATACAVLMTLAPAARAQDWPNRSILAVSTVSAGNAGGTIARIVLDQVSKQIGQSFVIEHDARDGVAGVARAHRADGEDRAVGPILRARGWR